MRRPALPAIAPFILLMTSCLHTPDISTQEQLQIDVASIDAYIKDKGITNVYEDQSGIRFTIETLGKSGQPPRGDQSIKAKYVGKYLDGTVFDPGTTIAEGPVGSFIAGWQYLLPLWPVGTKGKLFVPSPLGYGSGKLNDIPGNSILMFDMELLEVTQSNADKARFTADLAAIDQYLSDHTIDAVKDTTGVRYVITEPGEAVKPGLYDKVKFSSTGRTLANGTQFFSGEVAPQDGFDSRVCDYINGVKVGLQKIGKGGKITLYIPSALAFGPTENDQSNIPANSNIVYDIEL